MKKPQLLLLAGLLVGAAALPAAATPESRAAVIFLLIEPGARSQGMGESGVAVAEDGTSSYFNPASLSGQTGRRLNLTHMPWLPGLADDMSYEFVGYSQPVEGWGNFGVNFSLLNLGEQYRTGERGEDLGTFSSYDAALTTAYGADIGRNLSAGIALKFIRSNLADVGAGKELGKGVGNSFAADLGLRWRYRPSITFGAALRNMGPKIAYIDASQADPLPQHLVIGTAVRVLDTQYHDMVVALDVYKPLIADGSFLSNLVKSWYDDPQSDEFKEIDFHAGAEYRYGLSARKDETFLALRGGYSYDNDGALKLWTGGMGVRYNMVSIDAAYIFGKDTPHDQSIRYSMGLSF